MFGLIPQVRFGHGRELGEVELRAMWELRESLVTLKPSRDSERAWDEFRGTISTSSTVGRMFDPGGRLVAMLSFRVVEPTFEGRRVRLLLGGVGFVARDTRSHPMVSVMYTGTFVRGLSFRPGLRQFMCGINYPVSALRFAGYNERLLLPGLAELEPIECFVLEEVRRRLGGTHWDPERGAVDMVTIPEPLDERWLAKHRELPAFRRYVEQLPDWHLGYALPVAIEVYPWKLHRVLGPIVRRSWRRLRRDRARS